MLTFNLTRVDMYGKSAVSFLIDRFKVLVGLLDSLLLELVLLMVRLVRVLVLSAGTPHGH